MLQFWTLLGWKKRSVAECRRIDLFLMLLSSTNEEISQKSFVFNLAEIEEVSFDQPEKVQNKKHGNVTNRNGILRREQT